MDKVRLKAAILIVSDTAFHDPSTDKAGRTLADLFSAEGRDQWIVANRIIVPDNVLSIQREIQHLSDGDDAVNLHVTTGGTGFDIKYNTPEAVSPLIHRHAPGLV